MKRTRRASRSASPVGIVDAALQVDRERVDGEIATQRIEAEIAAESHLSVAAVGLDVLAKRRDLDRPPGHDQSPCRARARSARREARRAGAAHHLLGGRRRREVEIARRIQREVAHRPADEARLLAAAIERLMRRRAGRATGSCRRRRPSRTRQRAHSKRPCMSTPFSWARNVDAVAARRGKVQKDQPEHGGGEPGERQHRNAAAGPVLQRQRKSGA